MASVWAFEPNNSYNLFLIYNLDTYIDCISNNLLKFHFYLFVNILNHVCIPNLYVPLVLEGTQVELVFEKGYVSTVVVLMLHWNSQTPIHSPLIVQEVEGQFFCPLEVVAVACCTNNDRRWMWKQYPLTPPVFLLSKDCQRL